MCIVYSLTPLTPVYNLDMDLILLQEYKCSAIHTVDSDIMVLLNFIVFWISDRMHV